MTDTLTDYVQITRRGLGKLAAQIAGEAWGYGHCVTENDLELIELTKAFELLRNQDLVDEVCLCDEDIDRLKSSVHRILGPECSVVNKDFTRESNPNSDSWILANPYCLSYEYTADYLSALCKRVSIDFSIVERKCSDVDIAVKITDKGVCEALDLALKIEDKTCVIDLNPTVTLQECLVDFITEITPLNCGVSLEAFVTARNCGVSLSTAVKELSCAVDLNLDVDEVLASACSNLAEVTVDATVL